MIGKIFQGFVVGVAIGVLAACSSTEPRTAQDTASCNDTLAAYGDASARKAAAPSSSKVEGVARKTKGKASAR